MKILLHMCCGPCSIGPVKYLREHKFEIMGYFHRNNIHPYQECLKRQETLQKYVEDIKINMIYQEEYDLEGFLRSTAFREENRCVYCYHDRLKSAAGYARKGKFDYFSTTLLYSKFQNHGLIKSVGESIGKAVGVPFYYHDFRTFWKEGIEESKKLGMYRQQYCGCIYSEKERFYS